MTTVDPIVPSIEPVVSSINSTATIPWSYLGSVSSVSPVSSINVTTSKNVQDTYNGTGYYIEEDGESMLSDLKTVILACLATLVPLVIILITVFGLRLLWIQYKSRKKARNYDGILVRENTSENVSKPLHSHLLNDKFRVFSDEISFDISGVAELRPGVLDIPKMLPWEMDIGHISKKGSAETQLDINTEAVEICEDISGSSSRPNNSNGSIITMTLKNNHLIVETEERNDLEEDSRETTMRYSPSARDGVFVVEVQQGSRRSPGSGGAPSFTEPERSGSVSDQCALVHNPPEKYSDEETVGECDDSEYYVETASPEQSTPGLSASSKTGLSPSNTSIGSLRQSNTNQQCQDNSSQGNNTYHGNHNNHRIQIKGDNNSTIKQPPHDTKPIITSALYKNNTVKNLKSMSFDNSLKSKEEVKKKMLTENSSLDNVLESNGFEEFSSNLHKSKLLLENKAFLNETASDLDVSKDIENKNSIPRNGQIEMNINDTKRS